MNTLATSQYQSRLSSINNVAPGGSANKIAVFTSNLIIDYLTSIYDLFYLIVTCMLTVISGNLRKTKTGTFW